MADYQMTITKKAANTSGNSEVVSMHFPDSLVGIDFRYRKMTLGIYEIKPIAELKDEIVDKLTKAADDYKNGEYSTAIEEITKKLGGKLMRNISLPIPNELADLAAHGWSADTGLMKEAMDAVGITKLAGGIASKIQDQLGLSKITPNPGYFQNYSGSGPRFFSFTFNFIPNSQKEANTLIDIIMTIKKYSSPTSTLAGTALLAPHVFHIEFGNDKLNRLTNMRPCVLQSIDVNYSGSGFMETTMDGMPKHIVVSMSFAESRALTSDDWEI